MTMQKLVLYTVLLLVLLFSKNVNATTFVNGFGAGLQYGGIVGWQGGLLFGQNKVKFSIGYVGFAFGYDRILSKQISIGTYSFANHYLYGGAFNLNYHFSSDLTTGWNLGLDLYGGIDTIESTIDIFSGIFDFDDDFDDVMTDEKLKTGVLISVGYHF